MSGTMSVMADPDELIDIELTDEERYVLNRGVVEWGGPASCTDAMAGAMGFASVRDLFDQSRRLLAALDSAQSMSRWDWTRMLLATEIVFASNVIGSGWDWEDATGVDDARTFQVLRDVQLKLVPARVQIGPRPSL
jgi:hypothetical protein